MKMIITIDNVVEYLLQRKLMNIESIIDGDLRIVDISRRNRNMQVNSTRSGINYIVKQPNISDYYAVKTVGVESKLYSLVHVDPNFASIRKIMPRFVNFDSDKNILIVEYITKSQSFIEFIYRLPKSELPIQPFCTLGKMMGLFHVTFRDYLHSSAMSFLSQSLPPYITIIRPSCDLLTELSPANLNLFRLIQSNKDMLNLLDNFSTQWTTEQTLIHGDMSWENVIISDEHGQLERLKIADWELARIGDPAWDFGVVLNEFISFWVYMLPIHSDARLDRFISLTQLPIGNIKKSMRAFWNGYKTASKIKVHNSNEFLERSIEYCVIRLIQRVYHSHTRSAELSPYGINIIQICLNIISNIHDTIMYLFWSNSK